MTDVLSGAVPTAVEHRAARVRAYDGRATGALHLASIGDVRVEIDWSVLVVAGLTAVHASVMLARWHPGWSATGVWSVAALAGAIVIAIVACHELARLLAARAVGIATRRVTLLVFGGVSRLDREPPSARAEIAAAIVGPVWSALLGTFALVLGSFLAGQPVHDVLARPERTWALLSPLPTLVLWVAPVSLGLAAINLLPAFPLDAGRVLRALLWKRSGDVLSATRITTHAGSVIGLALLLVGLFAIAAEHHGIGLWLVLAGWFLRCAARSIHDALAIDHTLGQLAISDVMLHRPDCVSPHTTVEELVDGALVRSDQSAFPVVSGDRLLGLVCLRDLRRAERSAWPVTLVEAIMTPVERLLVVDERARASDALEIITLHDHDQVPVMRGEQLRGLVRRRELVAWMGTIQGAFPG